MKNYGDLGGCYLPQPMASTDNILWDLHNSSKDTQPHSLLLINNTVFFNLIMIDTCCSHEQQTPLSSSASLCHPTIQMSITHPTLLLYSQLLPILSKAVLMKTTRSSKALYLWISECSALRFCLPTGKTKGAFHLSELTGQTITVTMRISLLIKTIKPDQSNPK